MRIMPMSDRLITDGTRTTSGENEISPYFRFVFKVILLAHS
jgi:hypothetical protein